MADACDLASNGVEGIDGTAFVLPHRVDRIASPNPPLFAKPENPHAH